MTTEYIEVNSVYRDREQYPLSSSFIVPIAQSGNKTALTANDPVSLAYPEIVFSPFSNLSGTLAPNASNLSNTSSQRVVILAITANTASHTLNYYSGSVITFTDAGVIERQRIRYWSYLNTQAGLDYFEVTLYMPISSAQQANVSTIVIKDASSLADPNNPIIYIPESTPTDNYYIQYIIYNQTRHEWLPISYYNGSSTHLAQLNTQNATNYGGAWALTDTFVARREPPVQYGQNIVGINLSMAIIVPVTPSAPSGSYVGNFIRVLNTGQIVRITSFTTGTNTITVSPLFSMIPAGEYEMLQYSYNNEGSLQFNNSFGAIREAVCYDVTLINIVLPNFTMSDSFGGRAIFYPYVYVEFQSEKNSDRQGSNSIISNNPNANRMLFRALLNDNIDNVISPFVRLNGNGMVQTIKLDPQTSYRFSVHLPDGSLFTTVEPEYYSPSVPNPLTQISALFSFSRVAT